MPPFSKLTKTERTRVRQEIYYLNSGEIKTICDKHRIPYRILIEKPDGGTRSTGEKDRQKITIKRLLHYFETGETLAATAFKEEIVRPDGLPKEFGPEDRLYYGCYDKKNPKLIELLRSLTNGKYKNGAVARILMREFWAKGQAPTLREFAKAWLKAREDYSLKKHPEAAYLTDLSRGNAGSDWKSVRKEKAGEILKILDKIPA